MAKYVLEIKDKLLPNGGCYIHGDNLQRLEFEGMDNVIFDRANVTAKVYHYESGKIGALAANCNLLLESYEGE
jgi:hypothetical protein